MKKQNPLLFLWNMLKGFIIILCLVGFVSIFREYLANLSEKYDQTNKIIYPIIAIIIILFLWNIVYPYIARISE